MKAGGTKIRERGGKEGVKAGRSWSRDERRQKGLKAVRRELRRDECKRGGVKKEKIESSSSPAEAPISYTH